MKDNNTHFRFFIHSLRTSLIFIAGFLSYEFFKLLENEWNIIHPNNKLIHFSSRKILHFLFVFLADLLILYLILLLFDIEL